MKLTNIFKLGRFRNLSGKQTVNIWKGYRVGGIGDVYFYLFRHRRQVIEERHIHGREKQWLKISD